MRRETGITELENCDASKKNMSTEISFKTTAMTSFGGWGGGGRVHRDGHTDQFAKNVNYLISQS